MIFFAVFGAFVAGLWIDNIVMHRLLKRALSAAEDCHTVIRDWQSIAFQSRSQTEECIALIREMQGEPPPVLH